MANHMPNPIKSGFCFYWEPYYGIYRVRIFWKKLKNKLIKQSNVRNQFQYIVRIYPDDSTITWKNLLNCPHPLHPPSIDHIYIYIYIYIYDRITTSCPFKLNYIIQFDRCLYTYNLWRSKLKQLFNIFSH
jgi:hypothetical protein